jgi:hypothetical protein
VSAIPSWKRALICFVLQRKKARLANSYAKAAVDDLYYHGGNLFEVLRDRSDALYAELYDITP